MSPEENTKKGLDELIARWTITFDADTLLQRLESHGVPAGRIYRAPEMLADPHFPKRVNPSSTLTTRGSRI
ncbi:MAG: hypothetical protein Ct9H300mP8_02750 [Gammaproteobacteria bacterium]|nr:MAG: hypothetical protein Ct9H300mP8_02750 [Gammaproteobacteria bacterium]